MAEGFRLVTLPAASAEFRSEMAQLHGMKRRDALRAVHAMRKRLEEDPLEFGEALFHFKAMGVQMRLAVQIPMVLQFGVDATHRLVYIHRLRPLR